MEEGEEEIFDSCDWGKDHFWNKPAKYPRARKLFPHFWWAMIISKYKRNFSFSFTTNWPTIISLVLFFYSFRNGDCCSWRWGSNQLRHGHFQLKICLYSNKHQISECGMWWLFNYFWNSLLLTWIFHITFIWILVRLICSKV